MMFCIIITIHLIISLCLTFLDSHYAAGCKGQFTGIPSRVGISLTMIYSIICIFSLFFCGKIHDAFNISTELKIVALSVLIGATGVLICFLRGIYLASSIIFYITVVIIHTETVTWVLIKSFITSDEPNKYIDFSKYDTNFDKIDKILEHPKALVYFQQFLKSEFSIENLLFYNAVQLFKKSEPETLHIHALYIYECFIKQDAINELNISAVLRKSTYDNIYNKKVDITVFDDVIKAVKRQMETDSFVRFRRSKNYQQLLFELESLQGASSINLV